jgi:ribosome-binding protein aMBF1 (putative translation factor)
MKKTRTTKTVDLAEQLRAAIRAAGLSTYALARDARLDISVAVRFMNGTRGLNLTSASRVATLLGLELRAIRRKGR